MTDKSSRREFLQATAVAAVAGKTVLLEAGSAEGSPGPGAPRDRVRFGMIGVGMQGSGLLGTSVSIQGTECAAACDLYDGRHALAKEIAGNAIRTTRRYQDLLDDKSIDCIVAAVPDHWHKVPVYVRLMLACETPEVVRFLGTKGILELGETSLTFAPQRDRRTGEGAA